VVNESRELTVNSNNPNKLTVENATPWLEQDDRQPRAVAEGLAERNGRSYYTAAAFIRLSS